MVSSSLFKEIMDISLKESLQKLKKEDLKEICDNLELEKGSQLSKGSMIDVLDKEIRKSIPATIRLLPLEAMEELQVVIDNVGVFKYENEINLEQDELDLTRLESFGILFVDKSFDGSSVIYVPKDMRELIKSELVKEGIKEIGERNSEWFKLTTGILFYYGCYRFDHLIRKVGSLSEIVRSFYTFRGVLLIGRELYGGMEVFNDDEGLPYFISSDVYNPAYVIKEQQSRKELKEAIFSKQELLNASKRLFVEMNHPTLELKQDFISKYQLEEKEAKVALREFMNFFNNSIKPIEAIETLREQLMVEDIDDLNYELIMNMYNESSQWILKGNSPSDVELQVTRKPKLAHLKQGSKRNDPCHCGSGKKYKKCCL